MSLHKHQEEETYLPSELVDDESSDAVKHRREVRKSIEDRLEKKRLRDEIDELDGDFDWDELDR